MEAWGAAGTTLLRYEPLGVVAAMTPWNFPHTINVMKLGAALAAGNTLVLKPSPLTPIAGLALARIIHEDTDIPPGVVNVVTPTSVEASKVLTLDPQGRHGQLHRQLSRRPRCDGGRGDHDEARPARVRRQVGEPYCLPTSMSATNCWSGCCSRDARCMPVRPASSTAGYCCPTRSTTTWSPDSLSWHAMS